MGRQNSRLYYQGQDHKDIYFQGKYHNAMYIGNELVWKKMGIGIKIEFIKAFDTGSSFLNICQKEGHLYIIEGVSKVYEFDKGIVISEYNVSLSHSPGKFIGLLDHMFLYTAYNAGLYSYCTYDLKTWSTKSLYKSAYGTFSGNSAVLYNDMILLSNWGNLHSSKLGYNQFAAATMQANGYPEAFAIYGYYAGFSQFSIYMYFEIHEKELYAIKRYGTHDNGNNFCIVRLSGSYNSDTKKIVLSETGQVGGGAVYGYPVIKSVGKYLYTLRGNENGGEICIVDMDNGIIPVLCTEKLKSSSWTTTTNYIHVLSNLVYLCDEEMYIYIETGCLYYSYDGIEWTAYTNEKLAGSQCVYIKGEGIYAVYSTSSGSELIKIIIS